jgi:hypothetical protein
MNDFVEVIAIVEGKTEQTFIEDILAPYLALKNIYIKATQVSKPGQKGGDVKFDRVQKDIGIHLKQRGNTFITTIVDYYGVKEWPGIAQIPASAKPALISELVNKATYDKVHTLFADHRADRRFIPYIAVHEFEALLFSDSLSLSKELGIDEKKVLAVLAECGEPEAINNSPDTAPSKRLDRWSEKGVFAKTTKGIAIARSIGVQRMREQCPLFNSWLQQLENLVGVQA